LTFASEPSNLHGTFDDMCHEKENAMASVVKERTRLSVDLDPAQHRRAKILAAHQGRKLTDVVREMLDEWIEDAIDIDISDGILARIKAGGPTLTHQEVWAEFTDDNL
jgi:predicted DNA-binding protein